MTLLVDPSTVDPEISATAEELERLAKENRCPRCGDELIPCFGLAGGGYGPYVICNNIGCDFTRKHDLGTEAE